MKFYVILMLSSLAFAMHGYLSAQTTLNPEISVIPRFLLETNDESDDRSFTRPDLLFEELEVVFAGYLNPFARADVVLTLPGPDLEESKLGLEEVYATILRGLPFDLNVRFGKYRVEYGKINLVHPHAWSFVTQPFSQELFFGEEGLNDIGISASVLLPTGDIYTRLTVDLLRGSVIGETTGIEDTTGASPAYTTTARLSNFFPLCDRSDLEVGLSGYTGIHDPYEKHRFWYGNFDFKYKYKPSSYTSLVVQGEYLLNTRMAGQDRNLFQFVDGDGNPETRRITTGGMYLFADFQFQKIFSVGARYDWSQSPYSKDDVARGIALFFGYYPVEETLALRLQFQNRKNEIMGSASTVNAFMLQAIFSLGPHKAHPF